MSATERFVRLAPLVEVPDGEVRGYELDDGPVAVAHLEQDLFALADECPADGGVLSEGEIDASLGALVCPRDASAFDLGSGEPVAGPAVDPVAVRRVRVEEGWIEVGPVNGGP